MADQDQKITPIADATGDLSVGDLPPHLEPTAEQSPETETVKGGGINRVVVTDGTISAKP
jgi:hypothetical protein